MFSLNENCGLFGIYSDQPCVNELYYGIFKLQHRGQRYCGLATWRRGLRIFTHKGYVRHTFTPAELDELRARSGIGHVSLKERQPMLLDSRLGPFAIAFTGNIINAQRLTDDLKKNGHTFSTQHHVELLGKLIAQGSDFADGLAALARQVRGSYCVLLLTREGIYAARDPHGFKPLVLGRKNGALAVASESRPFNTLDFELLRDVRPGEILFLGRNGFETLKVIESEHISHCAFEWGYIASMDSIIDGVPVVRARKNLGASLARHDRVQADKVAAIPFSGIGYALGYHQESGLPYDEVFLIDRFASRSYLPLIKAERDEEARIKISVIAENVKGKSIVLCDDSIVRGTQIRNKVFELKSFGAREVHVRVGCPPLMAPCIYDISTRSYRELAARKYALEEIRRRVGADSLSYNSLEDLVQAIGLPKHRLCLACWAGKGSKR
ncbi:MAG TPA: amidophosphoribosyltransferase [bacterium]|uniref:Amidophosphoribosyltransferase n=1 Tax=candidate division TA06 bacterium ADurb.Bin417 TaxID=1852828 RepID=A0A1V5MBP5_UNCT6|nr:MAG: Amidophosphoribosyltransferase precursor [candidate division TA06 bacterium ADurb.Bin417]HNQ35320.1 amidophosphoribosyltransferase [bacterium]HNS48257.1 amidophosphoribosyltransferase [bacterium]